MSRETYIWIYMCPKCPAFDWKQGRVSYLKARSSEVNGATGREVKRSFILDLSCIRISYLYMASILIWCWEAKRRSQRQMKDTKKMERVFFSCIFRSGFPPVMWVKERFFSLTIFGDRRRVANGMGASPIISTILVFLDFVVAGDIRTFLNMHGNYSDH